MTLRVSLLCISIFIFGCNGWANSIGALKTCGDVCGTPGVASFSTDPAVCTCKETAP